MVRSTFLIVVVLAVALAIAVTFGRPPSTSAALDLSGEWTFTISGDFEGVCQVTLTQTGKDITGAFDCPGNAHDGNLVGTVMLQGQTHVLHATVTLHEGTVVLDVWDVSADIFPAGNNGSGQWKGSSNDAGSIVGIRNVPIFIKGDLNCDGVVDGRDVLTGARRSLGLDPLQEPYCPAIGSDIGVIFGDIDCNGRSDFSDAFLVLRYVAGLPVSPPTRCLAIGDKYSPVIPT